MINYGRMSRNSLQDPILKHPLTIQRYTIRKKYKQLSKKKISTKKFISYHH